MAMLKILLSWLPMCVPVRLSVAMLKILHFGSEDESVFAVFDGGYNDEVPKILVDRVPGILRDELKRDRSGTGYMRYTFLTAHK